MDLLVEAELRDAAARPGCSLCRVGEEAAQRYLRYVLHEGVNDGATRIRLDRSWGFCRRHAWHFLGLEWGSMHDSLGMATLSEGLVDAAGDILDAFLDAPPPRSRARGAGRAPLEGLARALEPAESCRACQVQAEHESYAATVLARTLEDPGWRQRFIESDGLCLVHFRAVVLTEESPERLRWLIEDYRRRLRELRSDLEEYARKHDYRFSQERYGREADVAVRATETLSGSWFDLPRRPRVGVEPERGVAKTKEEDSHG
jgi:hypothetical protein